MHRYVTLEELDGYGRVLHENGEVAISRVRYLVTVKQKMIENRTMQGTSEIPGLKSIEGRIFVSVSSSFIGPPMTLELNDGRRWSCYIQSGDGDLANRGGIT